ncbi:hypothetical protein [Nocardia wallacei]|uniref:hypothetical protein n=1 Tax=Nocardia wallacei TaxID=480035 RepID=UPI0024580F77|nr:hypothetical protein [Nocardia wallacei]
MIDHAAALVRWIETQLPEPGPGYGPWTTDPAPPGAVTATIHVRVDSGHRTPALITIALSASPDYRTV